MKLEFIILRDLECSRFDMKSVAGGDCKRGNNKSVITFSFLSPTAI